MRWLWLLERMHYNHRFLCVGTNNVFKNKNNWFLFRLRIRVRGSHRSKCCLFVCFCSTHYKREQSAETIPTNSVIPRVQYYYYNGFYWCGMGIVSSLVPQPPNTTKRWHGPILGDNFLDSFGRIRAPLVRSNYLMARPHYLMKKGARSKNSKKRSNFVLFCNWNSMLRMNKHGKSENVTTFRILFSVSWHSLIFYLRLFPMWNPCYKWVRIFYGEPSTCWTSQKNLKNCLKTGFMRTPRMGPCQVWQYCHSWCLCSTSSGCADSNQAPVPVGTKVIVASGMWPIGIFDPLPKIEHIIIWGGWRVQRCSG